MRDFVHWFENLTPDNLYLIKNFYTEDVYFKDPFNDLHSLSDLERLFDHMFENTQKPYFKITQTITENSQSFIIWDFYLTLNGSEHKIHGSTHIKVNEDNKIYYHRDYWDTGEEMYAKIPVLKYIYKAIRSKLTVEAK